MSLKELCLRKEKLEQLLSNIMTPQKFLTVLRDYKTSLDNLGKIRLYKNFALQDKLEEYKRIPEQMTVEEICTCEKELRDMVKNKFFS